MRLSITSLFLGFWFQIFSQSPDSICDLTPAISVTNMTVDIRVISEKQYLVNRKSDFIENKYPDKKLNSDSLEKYFVEKYPTIFSFKNNCYNFETSTGTASACKYGSKNHSTSWESYAFKDTFCGFVQINIFGEATNGYDQSSNIFVNPESRECYSTGSGNIIEKGCIGLIAYNDGVFIRRFKPHKEMSIGYNGWKVEEAFLYFSEYLCIKLKSLNCIGKYKYVVIAFHW